MDSPETVLVFDRVARAHAFLDKLFVRKVAGLGITEGTALDVGCGSGLFAIRLVQTLPGLRVVAVDLSEPMLELARLNAAGAGVDGVTFVQADAKALPFEDGSFDLVLSQHTLHHIPLPELLVSEAVRVARPGGCVLLRDLCRPRWRWLIALCAGTLGRIYDGLGCHARMARQLYKASLAAALSPPEWVRLAEGCGIPRACVSSVPLLKHSDILFHKA